MKSMKYLLPVILCVLVWPLASRAAVPAFTLDDLQKIVSLRSPQISPDGKQIAVVVSTPDWKTDKAKQEIDLVDVATGVRRALTSNREGVSEPRWSPGSARSRR